MGGEDRKRPLEDKSQQRPSKREKKSKSTRAMPQPNLNSDDYYEILGCPKDADDSQLKKAYRKLAVKWHPDKNPGDEQATKNFQRISEAFSTLSDSKKRKLYDQYGVEGVQQADHIDEKDIPTGGGAFPGFRPGGGGGVHHMSPEEAQAFFGQFFGGSDPFGGMMGGMGGLGGGMGGGMGGPGGFSHFSSSGGPGGMSQQTFTSSFGGGGGGDPFSMMFSQEMPSAGGQPRSSSMPVSTARVYDSIPAGTVVSLRGLVNAPERNGDRGVIRKYIPSTGRYVVEIEDTDETMSVKPTNLLQHVRVVIHDIKSQPEMNGKTATILAWDPNKERYNVYVMALQKPASLKPGNVVLKNGTVARLTGLNSRPELNGEWGTIKEWIRDTNKYDVQLSPQHVIRVKVENMRV